MQIKTVTLSHSLKLKTFCVSSLYLFNLMLKKYVDERREFYGILFHCYVHKNQNPFTKRRGSFESVAVF